MESMESVKELFVQMHENIDAIHQTIAELADTKAHDEAMEQVELERQKFIADMDAKTAAEAEARAKEEKELREKREEEERIIMELRRLEDERRKKADEERLRVREAQDEKRRKEEEEKRSQWESTNREVNENLDAEIAKLEEDIAKKMTSGHAFLEELQQKRLSINQQIEDAIMTAKKFPTVPVRKRPGSISSVRTMPGEPQNAPSQPPPTAEAEKKSTDKEDVKKSEEEVAESSPQPAAEAEAEAGAGALEVPKTEGAKDSLTPSMSDNGEVNDSSSNEIPNTAETTPPEQEPSPANEVDNSKSPEVSAPEEPGEEKAIADGGQSAEAIQSDEQPQTSEEKSLKDVEIPPAPDDPPPGESSKSLADPPSEPRPPGTDEAKEKRVEDVETSEGSERVSRETEDKAEEAGQVTSKDAEDFPGDQSASAPTPAPIPTVNDGVKGDSVKPEASPESAADAPREIEKEVEEKPVPTTSKDSDELSATTTAPTTNDDAHEESAGSTVAPDTSEQVPEESVEEPIQVTSKDVEDAGVESSAPAEDKAEHDTSAPEVGEASSAPAAREDENELGTPAAEVAGDSSAPAAREDENEHGTPAPEVAGDSSREVSEDLPSDSPATASETISGSEDKTVNDKAEQEDPKESDASHDESSASAPIQEETEPSTSASDVKGEPPVEVQEKLPSESTPSEPVLTPEEKVAEEKAPDEISEDPKDSHEESATPVPSEEKSGHVSSNPEAEHESPHDVKESPTSAPSASEVAPIPEENTTKDKAPEESPEDPKDSPHNESAAPAPLEEKAEHNLTTPEAKQDVPRDITESSSSAPIASETSPIPEENKVEEKAPEPTPAPAEEPKAEPEKPRGGFLGKLFGRGRASSSAKTLSPSSSKGSLKSEETVPASNAPLESAEPELQIRDLDAERKKAEESKADVQQAERENGPSDTTPVVHNSAEAQENTSAPEDVQESTDTAKKESDEPAEPELQIRDLDAELGNKRPEADTQPDEPEHETHATTAAPEESKKPGENVQNQGVEEASSNPAPKEAVGSTEPELQIRDLDAEMKEKKLEPEVQPKDPDSENQPGNIDAESQPKESAEPTEPELQIRDLDADKEKAAEGDMQPRDLDNNSHQKNADVEVEPKDSDIQDQQESPDTELASRNSDAAPSKGVDENESGIRARNLDAETKEQEPDSNVTAPSVAAIEPEIHAKDLDNPEIPDRDPSDTHGEMPIKDVDLAVAPNEPETMSREINTGASTSPEEPESQGESLDASQDKVAGDIRDTELTEKESDAKDQDVATQPKDVEGSPELPVKNLDSSEPLLEQDVPAKNVDADEPEQPAESHNPLESAEQGVQAKDLDAEVQPSNLGQEAELHIEHLNASEGELPEKDANVSPESLPEEVEVPESSDHIPEEAPQAEESNVTVQSHDADQEPTAKGKLLWLHYGDLEAELRPKSSEKSSELDVSGSDPADRSKEPEPESESQAKNLDPLDSLIELNLPWLHFRNQSQVKTSDSSEPPTEPNLSWLHYGNLESELQPKLSEKVSGSELDINGSDLTDKSREPGSEAKIHDPLELLAELNLPWLHFGNQSPQVKTSDSSEPTDEPNLSWLHYGDLESELHPKASDKTYEEELHATDLNATDKSREREFESAARKENPNFLEQSIELNLPWLHFGNQSQVDNSDDLDPPVKRTLPWLHYGNPEMELQQTDLNTDVQSKESDSGLVEPSKGEAEVSSTEKKPLEPELQVKNLDRLPWLHIRSLETKVEPDVLDTQNRFKDSDPSTGVEEVAKEVEEESSTPDKSVEPEEQTRGLDAESDSKELADNSKPVEENLVSEAKDLDDSKVDEDASKVGDLDVAEKGPEPAEQRSEVLDSGSKSKDVDISGTATHDPPVDDIGKDLDPNNQQSPSNDVVEQSHLVEGEAEEPREISQENAETKTENPDPNAMDKTPSEPLQPSPADAELFVTPNDQDPHSVPARTSDDEKPVERDVQAQSHEPAEAQAEHSKEIETSALESPVKNPFLHEDDDLVEQSEFNEASEGLAEHESGELEGHHQTEMPLAAEQHHEATEVPSNLNTPIPDDRDVSDLKVADKQHTPQAGDHIEEPLDLGGTHILESSESEDPPRISDNSVHDENSAAPAVDHSKDSKTAEDDKNQATHVRDVANENPPSKEPGDAPETIEDLGHVESSSKEAHTDNATELTKDSQIKNLDAVPATDEDPELVQRNDENLAGKGEEHKETVEHAGHNTPSPQNSQQSTSDVHDTRPEGSAAQLNEQPEPRSADKVNSSEDPSAAHSHENDDMINIPDAEHDHVNDREIGTSERGLPEKSSQDLKYQPQGRKVPAITAAFEALEHQHDHDNAELGKQKRASYVSNSAGESHAHEPEVPETSFVHNEQDNGQQIAVEEQGEDSLHASPERQIEPAVPASSRMDLSDEEDKSSDENDGLFQNEKITDDYVSVPRSPASVMTNPDPVSTPVEDQFSEHEDDTGHTEDFDVARPVSTMYPIPEDREPSTHENGDEYEDDDYHNIVGEYAASTQLPQSSLLRDDGFEHNAEISDAAYNPFPRGQQGYSQDSHHMQTADSSMLFEEQPHYGHEYSSPIHHSASGHRRGPSHGSLVSEPMSLSDDESEDEADLKAFAEKFHPAGYGRPGSDRSSTPNSNLSNKTRSSVISLEHARSTPRADSSLDARGSNLGRESPATTGYEGFEMHGGYHPSNLQVIDAASTDDYDSESEFDSRADVPVESGYGGFEAPADIQPSPLYLEPSFDRVSYNSKARAPVPVDARYEGFHTPADFERSIHAEPETSRPLFRGSTSFDHNDNRDLGNSSYGDVNRMSHQEIGYQSDSSAAASPEAHYASPFEYDERKTTTGNSTEKLETYDMSRAFGHADSRQNPHSDPFDTNATTFQYPQHGTPPSPTLEEPLNHGRSNLKQISSANRRSVKFDEFTYNEPPPGAKKQSNVRLEPSFEADGDSEPTTPSDSSEERGDTQHDDNAPAIRSSWHGLRPSQETVFPPQESLSTPKTPPQVIPVPERSSHRVPSTFVLEAPPRSPLRKSQNTSQAAPQLPEFRREEDNYGSTRVPNEGHNVFSSSSPSVQRDESYFSNSGQPASDPFASPLSRNPVSVSPSNSLRAPQRGFSQHRLQKASEVERLQRLESVNSTRSSPSESMSMRTPESYDSQRDVHFPGSGKFRSPRPSIEEEERPTTPISNRASLSSNSGSLRSTSGTPARGDSPNMSRKPSSIFQRARGIFESPKATPPPRSTPPRQISRLSFEGDDVIVPRSLDADGRPPSPPHNITPRRSIDTRPLATRGLPGLESSIYNPNNQSGAAAATSKGTSNNPFRSSMPANNPFRASSRNERTSLDEARPNSRADSLRNEQAPFLTRKSSSNRMGGTGRT